MLTNICRGGAEYGEVRRRLERKGSFGYLLAGEIAVEEAHAGGLRGSSLVSSHMQQAEISYKKARTSHKGESVDARLSNEVRAGLRLAQLGVLTPLFQKQQIPISTTIAGMYNRITRLGVDTLRANPTIFTDKQDIRTEVKGTLSEMAILALAQRHAIREADGEGWLPVQSLFSEDHGGNCAEAGTSGNAWDMTIFTQYEPGDPLAATYKIQSKTSLYKPRENGEVVTVSIMPDLQLDPRESTQHVISSVLLGCRFELDNPGQAERVTAELDLRTAQMLDVID